MNELYKENPSKFCEDYLDIKMDSWMAKFIDKCYKDKYNMIYFPYRRGRCYATIMLKILNGDKLNKDELLWIKRFTSKEVYNKVLDNQQSK